MPASKYLTTGEAASFLGISRSTVSRKFDQGLLRGKTNAITGERMISRESMVSFMKEHHLPVNSSVFDARDVLVVTADAEVRAACTALLDDSRISTEFLESGADALVSCAQGDWSLLILDSQVGDLPSADIISSLRKAEHTRTLPVFCCTREEHRAAALKEGADEAFAYAGLAAPAARERIMQMLKLSDESEAHTEEYEHQRRWPRVDVGLKARISVYHVGAPKKQEKGTAVVENISCGGAKLIDIDLPSGSLPIQPFRFLLEIDEKPLAGFSAHCQVVRFQAVGRVSVGLQFLNLSKEELQRIIDLIVV